MQHDFSRLGERERRSIVIGALVAMFVSALDSTIVAPSLPTISGVYPGADWHERECFDFYGIDFAGHPNLYNLLLPENFGSHPLIKAEKARKSLADLMPLGYLVDCGLAEPEAEKPKPAKVVKAATTEDA